MPQYLPLLVEVVLLGLTVFFFWRTQKLARQVKDETRLMVDQNKLDNVRMAQDVASILTELQSTAGAIQDDWSYQHADLQKTLVRAREVQAELTDLLAKAQSVQHDVLFPVSIFSATPEEPVTAPKPTRPEPAAPKLPEAEPVSSLSTRTMAQAIAEFGAYLDVAGRSETTAARAVSYVKGFAVWWGGQRYETVSLDQFDPLETEAYFEFLRGQNHHADTLKRKMNALKMFCVWVESLSTPPAPVPAPVTPAAEPVVAPAGDDAPQPSRLERRRQVLSLAEQGLDYRMIAAKTGLEQESVRMLLAERNNKVVS